MDKEEEIQIKVESGILSKESKTVKKQNLVESEIEKLDTIDPIHEKHHVDLLHPHLIIDKELIKYPLCNTNTGWLCCCSEMKTDLDELGIGTIVYLKMLKMYSICFLIISLINVPLIYQYVAYGTQSPSKSYLDYFYKTTIGNIGSTLYRCTNISRSSFQSNSIYNLDITCNTFNISQIKFFGISSNNLDYTNNLASCQNFTNYLNLSISNNCDLSSKVNNLTLKNCVNKSNCSLQLDTSSYLNSCNISSQSDAFSNTFFVGYMCYNNVINFGSQTYTRPQWGYVVVIIDIISMIILLFFVILIPIQLAKNENYFEEKVSLINDFTVAVNDLGFDGTRIYSELDDFIGHIFKVMNNPEDENNKNLNEGLQNDISNLIYEINYPIINNTKLDLIMEKEEIIFEKKEQKLKLNFVNEQSSLKEKIDNRIIELETRLQTIDEKIKSSENDLGLIDDVYVTFKNQKLVELFIKLYNLNKCTRFNMIICCQDYKIQHLYFRDSWLNLQKFPGDPSSIKWENATYSKIRRFFRKTVSIILALIIIAGSVGVVLGSKYLQKSLNTNYNTNTNCNAYGTDSIQPLDVYNEFNNNNITVKTLTYCFCSSQLQKNGIKSTDSYTYNNQNICHDWLYSYIQYTGVNIGIIIIIPFINVILVILLNYLTAFERNQTKSIDMMSNIGKIFILQTINTGIILLIVNSFSTSVYTWNSNFPFFTGSYSDFIPGWFNNVGAVIIFTMILNIIVPHVSALAFMLIQNMKRCMDSGCGCDGLNTKKHTKREYHNLYIGPEFPIDVRYSELLTNIFIVLIFSSGMPILYMVSFFTFYTTFWVDKYLILRYYKTPPHYDLYMSKVFNFAVIAAIIAHYGFGIWVYGCDNYFIDLSSDNLNQTSLSSLIGSIGGTSAAYRITLPHNILCFIFLLVLIGFIILRFTFLQVIIQTLCGNCFSGKVESEEIENLPNLMSISDLEKIRNVKVLQMKKIQKSTDKLENLKKLFENSVELDKKVILEKLKVIDKKEFDVLSSNFEDNIEQVVKKIGFEEKKLLGDISYNIAHIHQFHNAAIHEYLN